MGNETTSDLTSKVFSARLESKAVEGERTIIAVVSSSNFDRDNERVDVTSLRLPLKGGGYIVARDLKGDEAIDIPMLLNHSFDVEDVIGSVRKAYLNELNELVVEFGISGLAKAQDMMTLIDEGHLDNAFSITMNDFTYADKTIFNAEIIEISMVFRGSNKDARVLAVKSLIKGVETMADEAIIETPTEEIITEVVEQPVVEAIETVADEVPAVEAEIEPEPVVEEETKSIKKEINTMANEIAVKQVKDAVETEVIAPKAVMSADDQRILFVKQVAAFISKDAKTLSELNKKAFEASASKEVAYDATAGIFQTEVIASDIQLAYTNFGKVGALVSRLDITGAEKWKQPTQTAGNGFQPVGAEEEKAEDKPTWSYFEIEPKEHAMIVAWYDGMAKRTPMAVYRTIIDYIAQEYVKLEDKIVLSFAGVTTNGGDTFAATGLEPILRTALRTVSLDSYNSEDILSAFGEAYGLLKTDKKIALACNRGTWGSMATSTDGFGKATFTVVGQEVAIGALGTFPVVISEEVSDGSVIMGAFDDYKLVTNGGLATLFSQHATVGSLNLFSSDASALRASCDIAGKPVRLESFVVIDNVTVS